MTNGRNTTGSAPESGNTPGAGRIDIAAGEIDITRDRLGEILAARRHQLGLKIEEIAEDIKIRAEYLRFLEQEAFDKLPTPEYGRLFLKSYAERLGLNINDIYALYDVHHRPAWAPPARTRVTANDAGMPIGPTPRLPAAKPIPSKVWLYVIFGIVALALVIFGVMKLVESRRSADAAPATSGSNVAQRPVREPEPAPTASAAAADTTSAAATVTDTAEVLIPDVMELSLAFDRPTWVELFADNDSITSRIYQAGEILTAKGLDRFILSLGHTDGVRAAANGRPLKPFRSWTVGFKRMLVTADSIAAWLVPASAGGPIQ
ncbi:MAG TPA: RodZ domain-containing protein [bacterium]|nr:RodZ domain-containing protein [bacterium]